MLIIIKNYIILKEDFNMKRKGFLAILTAMAMIGSMGVCVYAADDAASTEDVLADYTGKADYKIGFSQ